MSAGAVRAPHATSKARSVRALVASVHAGLCAARALEAALLFLAAAWLARAAALLSGSHGGVGLVMALCGGLCAGSWWLEHALDRRGTARVLDRRAGQRGALVTAFELEGRSGKRTPMEELVRARVLAGLRSGQALRAVLPSFSVPAGATLAAGLALLFVLDARRAPAPDAADPRALAAGLERALALPSDAPETAEVEPELRRVRSDAHALAARLATSAGDEAGEPELVALDRRLAELLARVTPAGELAARLGEARTWLAALRAELHPTPDGATPDGATPEDAVDPHPDGSGAGDLTAGVARGTITGSLSAPGSMSTPPTPAPAPGDAPDPASALHLGVQAGSAWPREYDAVVGRWIELSRTAASGGERPQDPGTTTKR